MTAPDDAFDSPRFVALEERLTYQQHLIDQLNEVVLAQQLHLERLGRELNNYATAVARLAQSPSGEDLPHEKPPHY